jgi:hypothetical protein
MRSREILDETFRLEWSIRELDGFLVDNRSAYHIACCTWARIILRVAPGDQLRFQSGIIGVEIVAAQGWS